MTAEATSKYTSEDASPAAPTGSKPCVMPIRPAVPNTSAQTLHRYAAPVPSVISVSIVIAPWRALTNVARWNGHPPHSTTGVASTRDTHCQPGNCHAGTMPSATTGTARTALTIVRVRRLTEPGRSSRSCTCPPCSA